MAPFPLVASLYYSAEDPYAIRMAFHVGTDEPVEWIFARELLAAGLDGPPARRRPGLACEDGGAGVLNIALSSPFGQAHFEAPLIATAEFLSRTYGVIAGRARKRLHRRRRRARRTALARLEFI